jgi:hypothetical protein
MWGKREDWVNKAGQMHQTHQMPAIDVANDPDQAPMMSQADLTGMSVITADKIWDGTSDSVVKWINQNTELKGLDISHISKREVANILKKTQRSPIQAAAATAALVRPLQAAAVVVADVWDVQLAAALLIRGILRGHSFEGVPVAEEPVRHSKKKRKHLRSKVQSQNTTRTAFFGFVNLLANNFPESQGSTCRSSLAQLNGVLRDNWDSMTEQVESFEDMGHHKRLMMINPDALEQRWQFCGKDYDRFREGWHECKGTWPGKRGFTCGLWNMFHMVAAQTTDENALSDLQTMRQAISHFFDCQECRDHFMQVPVPEADIKSRRDAQLWWWNAHNVVNRRVMKLEQMYDDGDPAFLKLQYPSKADCPDCRTSHAVQPHTKLRLRNGFSMAAEAATSLVTVSDGPSPADMAAAKEAIAGKAQPVDVPVQMVTVAEAVEHEHWDLEKVADFLDRRYRIADARA